MQIQFIAQSCFLIQLESGSNIIIDPWLDNPTFKLNLKDLPQIDYVFCTHDHVDHGFKTAIEIANRDDAVLITGYDMGKEASRQGVKNVESCNPCGFFDVGELKVKLTHAYHSSDIGIPVGFMIQAEGQIIYHMGDTGYFAELKDYGEMYNIGILLIPIGGRYTMDPYEAKYAIESLNPEYVIPMHYNTFAKIEQNVEEFSKQMELSDSKLLVLKPGETIQI
jgi:L-ascorbate metabolism protein UlaG (beta-lactamase superfamily)